MKSIDSLEHGGADDSAPFLVRHLGYEWPLHDPRREHYQWVLLALYLGHLPSIPSEIPVWKHDLVFERWCAAWDLPKFNDARRLAYLVDNYRAAIAHDLMTYAQLDLGELWRARRWVKLLDVIDRLPAHSWYAASVAQDEDHARMMAESLAARKAAGEAQEDKGPALTTWTPEVAVMTNVLDAVRGVHHAIYAAQHGKKAGEPPKPAPRPLTALEKAMKSAELRRKKAAHEKLVARVLPGKSRGESPVH